MEEVDLEENSRRPTWYSIRHSTRRYVYDQECDFSFIVEILQHKLLESARRYTHPTPETKTDHLKQFRMESPSRVYEEVSRSSVERMKLVITKKETMKTN